MLPALSSEYIGLETASLRGELGDWTAIPREVGLYGLTEPSGVRGRSAGLGGIFGFTAVTMESLRNSKLFASEDALRDCFGELERRGTGGLQLAET